MADDIKDIIRDLDADFGLAPKKKGERGPNVDGIDFKLLDETYGNPPPAAPQKDGAWWKGFKEDLSWLGTAAKVGVGAARGVKDVIDTGAHGLARATAYVGDKVLPTNTAQVLRQNVESTIAADTQARNEYNKEYPSAEGILPNATSVGRFVGEVAGTAPLMPTKLLQGVRAGMGALPVAGAVGGKVAAPLSNRLGASAVQGGIGGGIFGAATSSANDKGVAENVGEGVITGLIGGPVLTGAASAARSAGASVLGSRINKTTADLAQRAQDLGIILKPTQISSSPTLKKYDQISGMMPFSGQQGVTEAQANSFTRAISRIWGDNTHEITPQVIKNARQRVGADIESVGRNATVRADNHFGNQLRQIVNDAHGTVAENELRPIATQIRNIVDKIDTSGNISGDAYLALTNYKASLSKAQNSSNPNIRMYANEIRNALDDALERSIPDSQRETLLAARAKYKAIMTVKDLAEADPGGQISPLKLMQKVINSPGGKLYSGELGEIADIGRKFFPQPADSGTPLGTAMLNSIAPFVQHPVTAGAAAAGALAKGATYVDLGLAGAALGVNRLFRNAVNSNAVRRSMIDRGLGNTQGKTNEFANRMVPWAAPLIEGPRNDRSR